MSDDNRTDQSNAEPLELAALQAKIKAILPGQYHDCYEDVLPVSMGSASLKFGPDGKVAWDEMWTTFCDLALAGGPPHRGTLLQPATAAEVEAAPAEYAAVVAEIARGVYLVTDLNLQTCPTPGWVGLRCLDKAMARWLVRAIVAENVMVRLDGETIHLPAGPHFRLAKEIKNVVTVTAKTCHYWLGHTSSHEKEMIGKFTSEGEPLLEPAAATQWNREDLDELAEELVRDIHLATGLRCTREKHLDWIEIALPDERAATWVMRAMIAENCLARHEGATLFLPNVGDVEANRQLQTRLGHVVRLWRYAEVRGIAQPRDADFAVRRAV